ncbi:MAG: GNAT family N-acetyltransferase [Meiothermus sp.]|nr:GNAT family N-acetyltransferase [Meiothermus sp.]
MFNIRPYHPSDLTALYRICYRTNPNVRDGLEYRDPDLLGHMYAAPYVVFEPDLCFVLTHSGAPCGYVLGTRDSAAFARRCEAEWFLPLRERYPLPDPQDSSREAAAIRLIHQGHRTLEYPRHPAELHIDLLPIAQGQGQGQKMMIMFLNRLREIEIPGVHLGVGKANTGAVRFYERLGFKVLQEHELWWAYGLRLGETES